MVECQSSADCHLIVACKNSRKRECLASRQEEIHRLRAGSLRKIALDYQFRNNVHPMIVQTLTIAVFAFTCIIYGKQASDVCNSPVPCGDQMRGRQLRTVEMLHN